MITAHVIIKNEERFVWYAVMSVVDHVDEVLLWDMGSTDRTVEMIEELCRDPRTKGKIRIRKFRVAGDWDEQLYRQKMLAETKPGWFVVVDGDEIWWTEAIVRVIGEIKENGESLEAIVVRTKNLVGDLFHYQEESAGHYRLAGRTGHLALRVVKTQIPGLHSAKPHGTWGWVDGEGKMIQDRDPKKIGFVDVDYLHATHLRRSGRDAEVFKRDIKRKYELGLPFPPDFYYPEVFFRPRPLSVPFVFERMDFQFWLRAALETPLRKLRRRALPMKEGY